MPITTKERYFGEGLNSYGEETPEAAFQRHRKHLRIKRLDDLLGKEAKLDSHAIAQRIEELNAAIVAADNQALMDNVDFIEKYNIEA